MCVIGKTILGNTLQPLGLVWHDAMCFGKSHPTRFLSWYLPS